MKDSRVVFGREALEFIATYPAFTYVEEEEPYLSGSLLLLDDQGHDIDTYHIKIVWVPDYPLAFPIVFETAGRIPVNIDWHVFPDGHCCITAIPEEILACSKGIILLTFFENYLKPYFFNQKHRELHGYFLHERSHGQLGNLEFFKEIFKTNDLLLISKRLMFIRDNDELGRTQICFCGSGKKYRKCHRDIYRLFKALSTGQLDLFIGFVLSFA